MSNGYGTVLIGESGRDPAVRLGKKIDDFDVIGTLKAVKEAAKAATRKQSDQIKRNDDVVKPAIANLEQAIKDLAAQALSLSNDYGEIAAAAAQNAFKDLQVYASAPAGEIPGDYIDVSIDNSTASATPPQAIRIKQLATFDNRVSAAPVNVPTAPALADPALTPATTPLGLSGSFDINGVTVSVAATDSLQTIIDSIDNAVDGTGAGANATARYLADGNGNLYLVISHAQPATLLSFADPDGILATNLGIDVTTATDITNLQAQIEIDFTNATGTTATTTMYYGTNTVTDLIPGTTLTLKNVTGDTDIYVGLSQNSKGVFDGIVSFFAKYNAIKETLNRNSVLDGDGNLLDKDATMPNSPLIRRLISKLDAIFDATFVNPGDTDYRHWQDIGVTKLLAGDTPFTYGTYKIDAAALGNSIATNFNGVAKLFGDWFASSNDNFAVMDISENLSSVIANQSITVSYAVSATGCTARLQYANGAVIEDTQYFELADPSRIMGPVGSVFEGLTIVAETIIPVGSSVTFAITASQGLAAAIDNALTTIVDPTVGEFAVEANRIKEQNKSLKTRVETAEERARHIEKQWNANTSRLYMERARYEQLSKFLDNMYKSMGDR